MTKSIKLMVVDDKTENLDAARSYFGTRTDLEVSYENNPVKAMEILQRGELNGALIDVFMPADEALSRESYRVLEEYVPPDPRFMPGFRKSLKAILDELAQEAPVGILAINEARRNNLPHVVVTSMTHHAKKFEAVYQYLSAIYGMGLQARLQEGWQGEHIISGTTSDYLKDDFDRNKNHPEFWASAYGRLEEQMGK